MSNQQNSSNSQKRGLEPDDNGFLPLSKRMKNLHLHNDPNNPNNHHVNHQQLAHSHQPQTNGHTIEHYDPDLTEEENPHYYRINKLLYDLHTERRGRQS